MKDIRKILVVEDDFLIAYEIERSLKRLNYLSIGVAKNETEFYQLLKNEPELILMDIRIDGNKDGIQLAEEIKDSYKIPIIFLTSHSDEKTMIRARKSSASSYLTKPFNDIVLRTNIELAITKNDVEKSLIESENRYKTLVETMKEGIIQVDNREIIEFVNNRFCKISGFTNNELIGNNANKLLTVSKEDSAKFKKRAQDRRKGKSDSFETQLKCKSGNLIWVAMSSSPVLDENNQVVGSVGIITDITEEKKVRELVIQNEKKYRQLADTALDAVISFDDKYNIETLNPAAKEMFKYNDKEILGQNINNLIVDAGNGASQSKKRLPLLKSSDFNVGKRKDGTTFPIEISLSQMEVDGKTFYNAFIRNVYNKKENQIKVLNALLEGQEQERKRISQELHDGLGQKLAGMNMNLAALKRIVKDNPAYLQLVDISKDAIAEYRAISHNLVPPALKEDGLQASILLMVSRLTKVSNVEFVCNVKKANKRLPIGIELELFRITQELINNALKYSKSNKIIIDLAINQHNLTLSVEDFGVGFDKEILNKTRPGIGIGNVKTRATLVGGELEIKSKIGKGTRVQVKVNLKKSKSKAKP